MKVTNFADKKLGLEGHEDDIVMGLAEDNHLTLLNSLTHLYSNPVMAALREYCANASDAHKDAGQAKPFEVVFPYSYDHKPNLRIRDYGKGMSREQLTRVYSQYGATTKAGNNAQVGGFGLGSKSGLAVSNHLFVNTVANGVRIEAKVLRNQNNTSVIRILSEKPTKDPSGTEIILPITGKNLGELRENAATELVGYKPEQVTLNGSPLAVSVHNPAQFIPVTLGTNVLAYITRNSTKQQNDYHSYQKKVQTNYSIIMGGVYYPTLPTTGAMRGDADENSSLFEFLDERFRNSPQVILNVPVGSVDLPPHRDSIIDTEKTWNSLLGLFGNIKLGLDSSLTSYLNKLPVKDASAVALSMSRLFCPDDTWVHKGKTYNNDMQAAMEHPPTLFSHVSSYYYSPHTQLEGQLRAGHLIALHTRTYGPDYNYTNAVKRNTVVVNLKASTEKYEEVRKYLENQRAHHTQRVTMNKPRLNAFITRNITAVVNDLYSTESFWVVVTDENHSKLPENLASAIDLSMTETEIKAEYKRINPPKKKAAVTQKHCRAVKGKISYSPVTDGEEVVFYGGKDSYGTDKVLGNPGSPLREIALMKKVSTGSVDESDENSWAWDGFFNIIPKGASLIALGDTRSAPRFQKVFPMNVKLGDVVMDFYDNLDDTRKLAVQHAYSIFALWSTNYHELFNLMKGRKVQVTNKSIEFMFNEPELISVAHYLWAFKDTYVEGLSNWKGHFLASAMGKDLAGYMLLPIQSFVESLIIYRDENRAIDQTNRIPVRNGKVRGTQAITLDSMVGFIDKLTVEQ